MRDGAGDDFGKVIGQAESLGGAGQVATFGVEAPIDRLNLSAHNLMAIQN